MDLSKYFKTPLEQSIEDVYVENKLLNSWDLTIDNLTAIFNVEVTNTKSQAFSDNEQRIIFLSSNDIPDKQRRSFFHELGHIVRHSGDQRNMPDLFQQMQEADAERFSLYASIPFFMLEKLSLPKSGKHAAGYIGSIFHIPPAYAMRRLRQIRERISGTEYLSTTSTYIAASRKANPSYLVSTHPVIKGMYGLDDLSRPHTLVIEQRGGFDWEKPLYIEVDHSIKSVDPYSYSLRDGAVVYSGDLSIAHERAMTIDMKRIATRYGQEANRLYLPVEAMDDALNF
ncbi:ImmA/IrrE family metallo-endopeptidase [Paenibacillus sp. 19GGS1-52]|uniref:ImmA/IrrE family metallo-endopeptidase n=1 Tax=Paenibacillus sp. 19GGS1-52 TaxID=2758563 RepID=UPI001EFB8FD9|nr:ImmA/IrrE family metallo-endopeptidase [Paenibacillus sp. 19GGS1-52]ULO07174.1 ImmA/IrrE family metallo-endopeptidase [Paenibacillus sp. 19GGS1-52]